MKVEINHPPPPPPPPLPDVEVVIRMSLTEAKRLLYVASFDVSVPSAMERSQIQAGGHLAESREHYNTLLRTLAGTLRMAGVY